jgi:hypothetical protein
MEFNDDSRDFIIATLRQKLTSVVKDVSLLEVWLSSISSHLEALRLASCIAFDLQLETVGPVVLSILATVFEHMDRTLLDQPNVAFSRALENALQEVDVWSSILPRSLEDSVDPFYVRILRLQAFIDFYVGPSGLAYTIDGADTKEVRRLYFTPGSTLEGISKPWSGKQNIVWICSGAEFQDVLTKTKDPASFLNDVLGLGFTVDSQGDKVELVAITYPRGYPRESYQPLSLHADWESDNFFLPYWEADGWGRTHSCSGGEASMKERIHKGYDSGLSSDYHGHYLGIAAAPVINRDALYEKTTSYFLRAHEQSKGD